VPANFEQFKSIFIDLLTFYQQFAFQNENWKFTIVIPESQKLYKQGIQCPMKKKHFRLDKIVQYLRENKVATIKELAELFNVTTMTIRRDFKELSEDNVVKLIPGGAIFNQQEENDVYFFSREETRNKEEKSRIGEAAATLVQPNDTIVIDTGSTTEYVARYIPRNTRLTVICYSLNIINIACRNKDWNVIVPGGYFHENSLMFESEKGIELIRSMRAGKCFIAASGISNKLGVTCTNIYEIETKKAVIKSSDTRILVADSTKFNKVKIAHFAELSDFDIIITDKGIPEDYRRLIQDMGITLYIV